MYSWESGGSHIRRKKVNKTGTVVFHKDPAVDTAFTRLAKEHPLFRVQRHNTSRLQQDTAGPADDEENAMQFVTNKDDSRQTAPFMTEETISVLSDAKGPFKFEGLLPSQAQCYKGIFKGRDVILHSQTGSGKTLAYALPLIERFLILDQSALLAAAEAKAAKAAKKKNAAVAAPKNLPAPFMLIFVFSNELAYQTKTVLDAIYGRRGLKVAVAGMDNLSEYDHIDILIGTVPAMDDAVRGKDAPLTPMRAGGKRGGKRARDGEDAKDNGKAKEDKKEKKDADAADKKDKSALDAMEAVGSDDDSDLDSELNAETSSDEEDEAAGGRRAYAPAPTAQVSVSKVRCVVVDEVDTTLGPRFSVIGKRMKMLLHTVRRANGSLQPTRLMKDFRAHHYVLCGATIPNWVIKAGFLGLKKYYFQLVEAGQRKLPSSLECYLMLNDGAHNPAKYSGAAVANAPQLNGLDLPTQMMCEAIGLKADGWGRVVIFGTTRQIDRLEGAMNALLGLARGSSSAAADAKKGGKKGEKAAAAGSSSTLSSSTSSAPSPSLGGWANVTAVRSISSSKDESDRIKNIADYNTGVANVLLCTDIASRGLDFVGVDVVFMLHLPSHRVMAAETFVHRAGRTARVNAKGKCIALTDSGKDEHIIKAIETATHVTFRKMSLSMLPVNATTGTSAFSTAAAGGNAEAVAPTAAAAAEEKTVKRVLVVKSPFVSAAPAAAGATAATPAQVLIRELKGKFDKDVRGGELDLFEALVKRLHVVDNSTVTFETPLVYDHVLTGKLWKYSLKIQK